MNMIGRGWLRARQVRQALGLALVGLGMLSMFPAPASATTTYANYISVSPGGTRDILVGDEMIVTGANAVVGYDAGPAPATLNVYGLLDTRAPNTPFYIGHGFNGGSLGKLTIAAGASVLNTNGNSDMYYGIKANSRGILEQSGGVQRISGYLYAGLNGGSGDLTISGGEVVCNKSLVMEAGSAEPSVVRLLGGLLEAKVSLSMGQSATYGTPILAVSGGVFRVTGRSYVGHNAGASGQWLIGGGSNICSDTIYLGYSTNTTGDLRVSGGCLDCTIIMLTYDLGRTGTMLVSGGKVVVREYLTFGSDGGNIVVEGSGEIDLTRTNGYKTSFTYGSLTNRNGGTVRWVTILGSNGDAVNFVNSNATLAVRDVASANITENLGHYSFSRITKQLDSRLALENSTNTLISGGFVLQNANGYYQSLILRDGNPRWQSGALAIQSSAALVVSNTANAVISGQVTNAGLISVADATATFDTVRTLASGSVRGATGAVLRLTGSFLNASTQGASFDLSGCDVIFTGGGAHTNAVMGVPEGGLSAANFAYGALRVEAGNDVYFTDGDGGGNKCLFVGHVDLAGSDADAVSLLHSPFDIYYQPTIREPRNAYLNNGVYALDGGGTLRPIPQPGTTILIR
ncbi:MAG: hypothetical protein PHR35_09750 [Kiritimatiellae bacterium]|nr:hypothetical protein [Kiritimatiellia bacterium]